MLFITISFVQDNYVNIHHRRPISNNTDYKSGVSNIDLGPRIGWKKAQIWPHWTALENFKEIFGFLTVYLHVLQLLLQIKTSTMAIYTTPK